MSLLDAPQAQALLHDATVEPHHLTACRRHLTSFLDQYLPLFYRKEQAANAAVVVQGFLSDLERKTCEPIARRKGLPRKPVQFFVGAGKWDDEAVMAELARHVTRELRDPHGALILDSTTFPKKGTQSCGVKRQWCGRLGKIENCQAGVFLVYATGRGCGPLDRRLFLPHDWATDPLRRRKTHVPPEVAFSTKWQIGAELMARHAARVPHAWILGDDDFGRAAEFRAQLRNWGERYLLDVPCDTLIRDLERRRPPRRQKHRGRKRQTPFCRADHWANLQPPSRWERFRVCDGEKGPQEVLALTVRVRAKHAQRVGAEERLLVIRTLEESPRTAFVLSNADAQVPLAAMVRVHSQRQRIEEFFQAAKGEAGLSQYEVRSWVGWHHHITLSLLAIWFVTTERLRLGEKNPGFDSSADPHPLLATAS